MNAETAIGIGIVLLFAGLAFFCGWLGGHSAGRKKGFYEGWEDGSHHTEIKMTKEFNNAYPDPFRKRLLDSNRRAMPRSDSAGPMRVHAARVRGDFRLPENNPDRRDPPRPPLPSAEEVRKYLGEINPVIRPGIPNPKGASDPFDDGRRSAFDD